MQKTAHCLVRSWISHHTDAIANWHWTDVWRRELVPTWVGWWVPQVFLFWVLYSSSGLCPHCVWSSFISQWYLSTTTWLLHQSLPLRSRRWKPQSEHSPVKTLCVIFPIWILLWAQGCTWCIILVFERKWTKSMWSHEPWKRLKFEVLCWCNMCTNTGHAYGYT